MPTGHHTKVLLTVAWVLLLLQPRGQAQPQVPDALPYSKGFLVTGNYITGGVDFTPNDNPADSNGYATGVIPISDAATAGGAHLVAAYVYFEAVHPYPVTNDSQNPTIGIKFRGSPISPGALRVSTKQISSGGAPCWGAAGQGTFAVSMFRANVLSLMPKQLDLSGNWTGKYIVNSSELPQEGQHTVTLREKTGDSAIQTAGATLFLVYRLTTPSEPLRKIVVYDGLYTAYNGVSSSTAEATTMSQKIRGFYKSAGSTARITHLVGSGGNNQTETIAVTSAGSTVTIGPPPNSNDPFPQSSPSSDRSWATATYNLTSFMPGTAGSSSPNDRYGERVTTTVQATSSSPAACRAWGAVFFSTQVLDFDNDGLPDGVEDAAGGLRDPDNVELPNLNAMGAKSKDGSTPHPDLFLEVNAMWAGDDPATPAIETTTYGSTAAPYPNTTADCYDPATKSCTDTAGHHHFPTPADLKKIGDRFAAQGITTHFDVGSVAAYHSLGVVAHTDWIDDYQSTEADQYLVGNGVGSNAASHAGGGEIIRETACAAGDAECQFPDFPGTVGWKAGLLTLRNAPVGDNGEELNPDLSDPNDPEFDWLAGPAHRVRFDRQRRPFFHYLLGAHARGTPSSPFPCLVNGVPSPYQQTDSCGANPANPAFHVPSGSGGLADLPGRNMLVSMGLWDEFVGRPYARQATIFHELGHNLNLWHMGTPASFGNAQTATSIQPNCKPNHFSTMSYLFQLHGLFDLLGNIHIDYSHEALGALNESALADGEVVTAQNYRPAWYAPASSDLAGDLEVDPATRFCDGTRFATGEPGVPMARVESDTFDDVTDHWEIDWNGNRTADATTAQDASFDGTLSAALSGYHDWTNIRLNQISANGITGGSDDFVFLVGSDDLFSIIGSDDFPSLIGGDELPSLIGSDELAMLIGADDMPSLIGSDDFFSLIGSDDLFMIIGSDDLGSLIGSDDLGSLIGSDDQEEVTYKGAQESGRVPPYELKACNAGTPDCVAAQPFTPQYHRVSVGWTASTVGNVDHYQVQRKRTGALDSTYEDVGTSATNSLLDEDELPPLSFTYRVRTHFTEAPFKSGWSMVPVTITPVNELPAPQDDRYEAVVNTVLIVPAPGVLGNDHTQTGADRSSDSPTAYVGRKVQLVTNVAVGTLSLNANGGFTYTPPSGFDGTVTFTYKVNDGAWVDDSTVPLNGTDANGNELFSAPATVTIVVRKKNPK